MLPQFSTNCQLSHIYDGKLTTKIYYNYVPSLTTTILKRSAANDKAAYSTVENLGEHRNTGLSLSATKKLLQWWELSVMAFGYYNESHNGQQTVSGTGYYFSADSSFVFKNGWRGELHLTYAGPSAEGALERSLPYSYNSCGVSKSILKDSGTLRLYVDDPFMVYRYNTINTSQDVYSESTNQYNTFAARLSFTYNFGKKYEARQRDNNMDEARRL